MNGLEVRERPGDLGWVIDELGEPQRDEPPFCAVEFLPGLRAEGVF
jgi:hypothetical protein